MRLGDEMPLPIDLATLYGSLRLPVREAQPYLIGNFVTTLDGVVSLNISGQAGGGEISGFNQHDRMVMGILRAVADAVIVGAGTLRASPQHRWIRRAHLSAAGRGLSGAAQQSWQIRAAVERHRHGSRRA